MKWKTRWSKCIYVSPSGYIVYQNWLYRWLTLGSSAVQTLVSRINPKKPVLYYINDLTLMALKFPGSSCVLGLGGGSILHVLSANNTKQSLVVVDVSEEIIHIAKQFFMLDAISDITIVHQNANDYVAESVESYQHLIVDLYGANNFPLECNHSEFFMHAKNRLTDDGYLSINIANYNEQWPIFRLIKEHFTNTLVIPVKKSANIVIIASKSDTSYGCFLNQIQVGLRRNIVWVDPWGFVVA